MKYCLVFILLVLNCLILLSHPNDSIVKFSDLHFKNEHEKIAFQNYTAGTNSDLIDLFLSHFSHNYTYSSLSAHRQILESTSFLKEQIKDMNEERKIKYIFKYIHKRFFKLYSNHNSFSDIFEKGEYNCVSGSAMFAIVFNLLGIPFEVIEEPGHVYLFAYPHTRHIMVESTIPKNGYLTFSESYILKFVKFMGDAKLISPEDLSTKNPNELFNKYYFRRTTNHLKELASIQYSNYALYHLDENDPEKALTEAKKAYYIVENERNRYNLKSILHQQIQNTTYRNLEDIDNLVMLCRFNNQMNREVSAEFIRYEFLRLTYEQLVSTPDPTKYEQSFKRIINEVKDTSLSRELEFIYHYEMGRIGNNTYRKSEFVMGHLRSAYHLKPLHEDLRQIIKLHFVYVCDHLQPASILTAIEDFGNQFDFLKEEEAVISMKANCLLELAYQSYTLHDHHLAETFLNKFEGLNNEVKVVKPNEKYVEKAYSSAAMYHYKKGEKARARQLLKTGIKYAPESFGLMIRLNQVK